MKRGKLFAAVLLLAGVIGPGAASAGAVGVVSKETFAGGGYCHTKFTSIQEDTLGQARPVLKDGGSGDIVDFYGPCDHDPLGKDEIRAQELESQRRSIRDFGE